MLGLGDSIREQKSLSPTRPLVPSLKVFHLFSAGSWSRAASLSPLLLNFKNVTFNSRENLWPPLDALILRRRDEENELVFNNDYWFVKMLRTMSIWRQSDEFYCWYFHWDVVRSFHKGRVMLLIWKWKRSFPNKQHIELGNAALTSRGTAGKRSEREDFLQFSCLEKHILFAKLASLQLGNISQSKECGYF